MNYAIVDLGSNTVRLSVYSLEPDKSCRLLFSDKETAGLNNYLVDRVLSKPGIQRACDALNHFRGLLEQFGVEQMRVFATASLRNIQNTQQAVEEIAAATGIQVEVISGALEAELGYYGVIRDRNLENGVVFDIGGGSAEIARIQGGRVASAQSIPIGCLELFHNIDNLFVLHNLVGCDHDRDIGTTLLGFFHSRNESGHINGKQLFAFSHGHGPRRVDDNFHNGFRSFFRFFNARQIHKRRIYKRSRHHQNHHKHEHNVDIGDNVNLCHQATGRATRRTQTFHD